jgi:sigma-E factor negative regulatory protein RseC
MMLEETGVVTAVDGEFAWVETQPKSACGHCTVSNGCGTSVLAKWYSPKKNQVRVVNHLNLQPGAAAVLGVANDVLIKAAFIAYMLPLLAMISFAIVGSVSGMNNIFVVISSLLGLMTGLWFARWLNNRSGTRQYQAQLIRGSSLDGSLEHSL